MAGLIPAGFIVDPSKDIFPSTGAHLDPRIIPQFGPNKGKPINPRTAKFLLQNVMLGDKPIVEQRHGTWQFNFPVTSEFGGRDTSKLPPGASAFHKGIDISAPAGTPIKYRGYGSYTPGEGLGTIRTTDAQGNPYDIQLLHTVPAKASEVVGGTPPPAPVLPGTDGQPQRQDTRTSDLLEAFLYGTQYKGKDKEEKPTLANQLLAGALSQALSPQKSFISQYIQQEPYIQGQAASTYDYLQGLL